MAELSSAEAYIAGPKGREYAAVALDRADSSAKPWAWVTGGRSPACHPSHVAANAGFGAEPQEVRIAHFNSASSARRNRRHAHGILNADASIQFGIQFFKERRQHCGVETDALTDGNGAYLPERVMSFGVNCPTLSAIFEKGGGLCLRLKTASETSVKQAADWLSHLHNAPSSSRLSAHRQSQGIASTPRPQTAMSSCGLRAPLALRWSSVSITPYSSFHRTTPPCGGKRRYLVPVARSFTTHFGGAGSSKGRSTSFLLSVASNNHYMEVAA